MDDRPGPDGRPFEEPRPSGSSTGFDVGEPVRAPDSGEGLAPSEAFQALASEVRVSVLCALLAAERAGETSRTFSELRAATDADTSAGFAYHLRQLDDHFVRRTGEGYVLTPAGRRAAEAIVAGTFTPGPGSGGAS